MAAPVSTPETSRSRVSSGSLYVEAVPLGGANISVLPPISTKGLSTDDVNELIEKTRDQMLATLRQISLSAKGIEAPVADDVREETFRPEAILDSAPEDVLELKAAAAEQASSPITTEDEMEGDAVLLKRPNAGAVAQ